MKTSWRSASLVATAAAVLVLTTACGQESGGFFTGEHHRRQPVSVHNGISKARLTYQGDACFFKCPYIPVDGPEADLKPVGNILGLYDLPGLEMYQYG